MHTPHFHYGGRLDRRAHGVPVADLVGLDAARRLAGGGWRSLRHFLVADAREVALRTGLPEAQVRAWQEAGGLRGVPGLGPRGAEALVGVGVADRAALAAADADPLAARLRARFGARAPPADLVARWVASARAPSRQP